MTLHHNDKCFPWLKRTFTLQTEDYDSLDALYILRLCNNKRENIKQNQFCTNKCDKAA